MRRLLDFILSNRDYVMFLLAYCHGVSAPEVGMLLLN
jgi:hypothetical protein